VATVAITATARDEFNELPLPIQARVRAVFARLANWPAVSGAKPLRGNLKGSWHIRTGDYRVVFSVAETKRDGKAEHAVTVWKIGYRGDVYD
jgi:mRNA-degrading endonuclease RelE of RelBE toxin-antitoxin system